MYDELLTALREKAEFLTAAEPLKIKNAFAETMREAADAIEGLSHAVNQMTEWRKNQWIPVTERLPEDDIVCILTNGISDAIGYRGKVFGWHLIWTDYVVESEVTHWMPLPEPPKVE